MKSVTSLAITGLFGMLFLTYCKKDAVPIPVCIQQKIDSIRSKPERTPPAEVHAWTYGGRKVYLLNASCCNEFVKVFDENCKYICSPSGGPTNIGDSLCTDFYLTAKYQGLIFRDNR